MLQLNEVVKGDSLGVVSKSLWLNGLMQIIMLIACGSPEVY